MSGYTGAGFGARGFGGGGAFGPGQPLADAFEQLRSVFETKVGQRMSRGDVRAAVLALLAEQSMHGYQIIAEIEKRSGGAWKPSAGSVYPTLQLLADEGVIAAEASDGRKTYSLTDEGKAEAEAASGRPAPWEASGREFPGMGALPKSGIELAQAVGQVHRSGSPEQVQQAVAVLDEARRKLYSILAQD
ncbi:MAG: PadR family transcriptional regulator [Microbacteriaceae bacterium]|nr:PadR family transcriptional regulator [Microbacteriaceae bacterium]MCL2796180.1 PadR family transcriptional regulator [Microbacteriaceae bacterium]